MAGFSESVKVTVRKGNFEVTIECLHEQLQLVIQGVLESIIDTTEAFSCDQMVTHETMPMGTCRSEVIKLLEESWFSSPRCVKETHLQLAKHGFYYHPSAVAHVLAELTKDSYLVREGIPRRYAYKKKCVLS